MQPENDQNIELQPSPPLAVEPHYRCRIVGHVIGILFCLSFVVCLIVVFISIGCGKTYETVHNSSEFCQNIKRASTIMKFVVIGWSGIVVLSVVVSPCISFVEQRSFQ